MDYGIIRRFYSTIKANIYYLRLKDAGINCFLSQENISTILPLADGGVFLNVDLKEMDEATELMAEIDLDKQLHKESEDFRDATVEDIYYEKEVVANEKRIDGGWLNGEIVTVLFFALFVIVAIVIVVNFFFPFFI